MKNVHITPFNAWKNRCSDGNCVLQLPRLFAHNWNISEVGISKILYIFSTLSFNVQCIVLCIMFIFFKNLNIAEDCTKSIRKQNKMNQRKILNVFPSLLNNKTHTGQVKIWMTTSNPLKTSK